MIGDTVNQASRIESLNKKLGSDILISDATVMMIKNQFEFGPSISLNVKGKSEKVVVHEIVGSRDASGHVHTVLAADVVNNLKNRDVRSLSAEESFPAPAGPWQSGTNTSGPQFRQTFEVSHPTYAPAQPVRIQTVTPQPSFAMHPPVTQTRVDLWYLVRDAQAKNPEGPYTSAQLQAMSQMPSTNLNTCFVFREGDAQMIPLFELPGMTRRTPEIPGVPQGLPLPPADVAQRTPPGSWLVYTPDGNLYGPYNFMQLDQMLQSGHLNRFSYVWQPGLHYWIYINQIPGFERRAG